MRAEERGEVKEEEEVWEGKGIRVMTAKGKEEKMTMTPREGLGMKMPVEAEIGTVTLAKSSRER